MPTLHVFRFDPDNGREPHFDTFQVPELKAMTLLEALFYIQENLDGSLAFRVVCRAAVCGSCAMHANGEYVLACRTQVSDLGNEITVRPLAHMRVIKDLIADMDPFWESYHAIKPYLIKEEPFPEEEIPQSPKQRRRLDQLVDCILCGACYGSCPVAEMSKDYLGPHALLKALRFVNDSRDEATRERIAFVAGSNGAFRCHTIFNCQQVCPKDLDPAGAIAKLKMKAVWYSIGRIFGRK